MATTITKRHPSSVYILALQDIEGTTTYAFGQITALARLMRAAMESPSTLRTLEDIARGLDAIQHISEMSEDSVFSTINGLVDLERCEDVERRSQARAADARAMAADVEARVRREVTAEVEARVRREVAEEH